MKNKIFAIVMIASILIFSAPNSFAETNEIIVSADGSTMTEIMTYDELVCYHAAENQIRFDVAIDELEAMGITNNYLLREAPNGYRVLSVPVSVTTSFKPRIVFYTEVSLWNSYWAIQNIYHLKLHREYNGVSKQFSGDLIAWLRGPSTIEYELNGDFYNNGTTTISTNVSVGVGGRQVSFGISNSSNHYKYVDVHDTKVWRGNEPSIE